MKIVLSITAAAALAAAVIPAAAQSTAPAPSYYYGLTENAWWAARRHAEARPADDATRRAPFAAKVNANGQGTN